MQQLSRYGKTVFYQYPIYFIVWFAEMTYVTDVHVICQMLAQCVWWAASCNDIIGAERTTLYAWVHFAILDILNIEMMILTMMFIKMIINTVKVKKITPGEVNDYLKLLPGTGKSGICSYNNNQNPEALQVVLSVADQLNVPQSTEWVSATCFAAAVFIQKWWEVCTR